MLSASAKAGVGAAGLALVGCGDDDDDDADAASDAAAAAAAGDASAAAEAAERAAAAAEEAAAAAAAAGDESAAAIAEAAAAAAEAAAEAARAAGADQAEAAAEAAAAAAAAAQDAAEAAREAAAAVAVATGPKHGGILNVGQFRDPNFATGHPFALAPWNIWSLHANMETIVSYVDDLTPSPTFAERYELSDDFTRVVIDIPPGIEFHDGSPVTADDVFFGVRVIQDPAAYDVTGAFQIGPLANMITEMKAEGNTLEFVLDRPRPNITDFFAQLTVTKESTYPELTRAENVQGTGPYAWKSYTPGEGFSLEPNPNWHDPFGTGGPYLDGIEVKIFSDFDAGGLAFEAGEVDVFMLVFSPAVVSRFVDQGKTVSSPKVGIEYLGLVVTNPMLEDPRVRQAIFYAIDRERMVQDVGFNLFPLTAQPWGPGSPAFDPALEAAFYDPDKARALLAEAGFTQDRPLKIQHRSPHQRDLIAQVVQANLADVGIETVIDPGDAQAQSAILRERGYEDMWLNGHSFADMSPLTNFQQTLPFQTENASHYVRDEYTDLREKLLDLEPSSAEAKEQYARFQKLWLEDPFLIPTGLPQAFNHLVNTDKVRGFPTKPSDWFIALIVNPTVGGIWLDT